MSTRIDLRKPFMIVLTALAFSRGLALWLWGTPLRPVLAP